MARRNTYFIASNLGKCAEQHRDVVGRNESKGASIQRTVCEGLSGATNVIQCLNTPTTSICNIREM
ncbi:MAG: hypothetical protein ACXV4C_10245 [Halobacteriota archaeon]